MLSTRVFTLGLALAAAAAGSLDADLVASAAAQSVPAQAEPRTPPEPAVAPQPPAGYLGAARLPDHRVFLPPPPAVGSPSGDADVAIVAATRALEGSPRWQLATSDDRADRKSILGAFGCAVGLDLGAAERPALVRVLSRSGADLRALVGAAKDAYQRPRPAAVEQGPICATPPEESMRGGSYPSGHAASGWLYALLLAEIDSTHAAAIINRGRAFGESRVVCGVHHPSDIEASRLAASALVATLHGTPEFETDVAAARAELTGLRAANAAAVPDAAGCASESAILATPW